MTTLIVVLGLMAVIAALLALDLSRMDDEDDDEEW